MAQPLTEFRYGAAVRRRVLLWLAMEALLFVGLIVALITRWPDLTIGMRILGGLLFLTLLFNMQLQFARLNYRCLLWPDRLQIRGRSTDKNIPWTRITEVRRVAGPALGRTPRWAATVLVNDTRDRPSPVYLFDYRLDRAEEALKAVVQHTPQAKHVNI